VSDKKITILTLSDHPLSPSGVGTQTRNMIEAMLETGKYKFISLGGAMKHVDYEPKKVDPWGEDWVIFPIDGYGNQETIRSLIRVNKIDILWFMTDPRFYGWLWLIENEIRPLIPMVYYHVWDNYPYPTYNKPFYDSNDVIATISKVTDDIVKTVSPDVESVYIPHAVDANIFKKHDGPEMEKFKTEVFKDNSLEGKFIFLYNGRNARRKQTGSMIFWFKEFLDRVGHDKAVFIMHTDVKDPVGQDLEYIIRHLKLTNGEVVFSTQKYPPNVLAKIYNIADCTLCLSDAEGFGLTSLESLACGTPVISTLTGGLQEQVTDGKDTFGVGIEPSTKSIIGSQDIPWIYEDRVSEEDVINAMLKLYNMSQEERDELGAKGTAHVLKNYSFERYVEQWDELFQRVHSEMGSWENRKNYKSWTLKEVV